MLEFSDACFSLGFCLVTEKIEGKKKRREKGASGCCGSTSFVSETRVTKSFAFMQFLNCQTESSIPFCQFLIIFNNAICP